MIDKDLIPESVYIAASRVLDKSIKKLLDTTDGRKEFEEWKKEKLKNEKN